MTPRRALIGPAIAVLLVATTTAGCRSSADPDTPTAPGSISFRDVDDAIDQRVAAEHLDGMGDLVVRDGQVVHRRTYGSYHPDTVVAIASASKWLTSATIMTLVDDAKLGLDDPVGTYLPEWRAPAAPDKAAITIGQLLSHQAGLAGSADCLGDPAMTLDDCAASIAGTPLSYPPGTAFHYGNAGYTVAAHVAEVVGGAGIEQLFQERIARPLGMTHTSFTAPGRPTTQNPVPAASGVSTLDDYGRFVAMMLAGGTAPDGHRVLEAASVHEILRDQVRGLDTRDDFAVQITGYGTYGLGVWRDRADAEDATEMVSGSGSVGFYPWVDLTRRAYGVLLVDDEAGGDGTAVRTSNHLVHDLVLPALDHTPR